MSIFRANALRNYMQGREETVLPRFVAPRVFNYLWLLLSLLALSTGVAWHSRYPVSHSALAFAANPAGETVTLVVLLSPDMDIQVGQPVMVTLDGQRASGEVSEVLPDVLSPHEIRERFALDLGAGPLITQPARVVLVEASSHHLPPTAYQGGIFQADIEVGSERVIALFPVIGDLFEE